MSFIPNCNWKAAGITLIHENNVLLGYEKKDNSFSDIGGRREYKDETKPNKRYDKTSWETALNELLEELLLSSIDLTKFQIVCSGTLTNAPYVFYVLQILDRTIIDQAIENVKKQAEIDPTLEITDFRWFSLEEIVKKFHFLPSISLFGNDLYLAPNQMAQFAEKKLVELPRKIRSRTREVLKSLVSTGIHHLLMNG